jgi:hypothetical protein
MANQRSKIASGEGEVDCNIADKNNPHRERAYPLRDSGGGRKMGVQR